nr:precorrin-6y C5,15-methyltransferase (decarboxylating) subunit CbiE [Lusitaniella coriacea]
MSPEGLLLTPIQVIGMGLEGAAGLNETAREIVDRATVLVGSERHLSHFPQSSAQRLVLSSFKTAIAQIRQHLDGGQFIVILVTGDPLFFGLGRLLIAEFPPELLSFHPHFSCVQLAFNRIKVPWQDARVISAHGRSLDELTRALQKGWEKIAVLTDSTNTPGAIARLYLALDLPIDYDFWVCEDLGGSQECVACYTLQELQERSFAHLNVVVLLRQERSNTRPLDPSQLPLFGLPDSLFLSFRDRPRLMTKREVRAIVLSELSLQPQQIVWDIGAGTGSVSIEIARLCPTSQVYAIEKTAIGRSLIEQNCQRLQAQNVAPLHGTAPDILNSLPTPHRIFIGGSGGHLPEILEVCVEKLPPNGILVAAFATLEHLNTCLMELQKRPWHYRLLQLNFSHSVPVGSLTRLTPLNPVTIVTASRNAVGA